LVGFDVSQQQINLIRRFNSNVQTPDSAITHLDVAKERSIGKRSAALVDKITTYNNTWLKVASNGLKVLATSADPAADAASLRKTLSGHSKIILEELGTLVEYAAEDGYNFSVSAKAQVDEAVLLILIALGSATIIGLAIATLLGLSISRSLDRIGNAMGFLSEGDKTIDIPDVNRRDEVGRMARALSILKDSLIEHERFEEENRTERHGARSAESARLEGVHEAEQEANEKSKQEARERDARASQMEEMIAAFDADVSGTLQTVTASAARLRSGSVRNSVSFL
jgi:HAMP domain-containing protein